MLLNSFKRSISALVIMGSLSAQAEVVRLTKGVITPYNGVLFSTDDELKNRTKLMELDFYKELDLISKQKIMILQNEVEDSQTQVKLWKDQTKELSLQVVENRDNTFIKNVLFFVLGAVLTTGIVYGVNQASK